MKKTGKIKLEKLGMFWHIMELYQKGWWVFKKQEWRTIFPYYRSREDAVEEMRDTYGIDVMNNFPSQVIDLEPYINKTSYIGEEYGRWVRDQINLDSLDPLDFNIVLKLPKETSTLTPSFYIGLLYGSVKNLGFSPFVGFGDKYSFDLNEVDDIFKDLIRDGISDGIRHLEEYVSYRKD